MAACLHTGCAGTIQDGYCDHCGLAAMAPGRSQTALAGLNGRATGTTGRAGRTRSSSTVATRRTRFGGGLVDMPPVTVRDPATAVMDDATVAEHRRFCGRCDEPVGRSRHGQPGRTEGYCRSCGARFSFLAKLCPGDLVAGQYEVAGCLAHGGLGWIYLARDRNVSDRWVVLKGLLDSADEDAMAAALAERRFLAEVEHPNIVKIHNFVEHRGDGYIVMEYVNGVSLRGVLEARRADAGGPNPLPVEQAIAYCVEILPALGHLHDLGLIFCDFKPDNVIQTRDSVKLIDLGGVYRVDDQTSPVYGTVGYQAPEIAETGPTVASDLFTVGRTLAVLATDFAGYQGTYRYALPPREHVPLYSEFNSLRTFLERATAGDPDERFQSADEMSAQLVGVLHEVVATSRDAPAPRTSTQFTPPGRPALSEPDQSALPTPLIDPDDPNAGVILALGPAGPDELLERLGRGASIEVDLWLARSLIEARRLDEAAAVLTDVEEADPWEWRAAWYRGVAAMAAEQPDTAAAHFTRVYRTLPGELAPKLALGMAAEASGASETAANWYDIVSRTDPAFTSASFGLARSCVALADLAGAVDAYERVLETSSAHVDARVAEAQLLLDHDAPDRVGRLQRAASIVVGLPEGEARDVLVVAVHDAALGALIGGAIDADASVTLIGRRLEEPQQRDGLERAFRALARRAHSRAERVALVEQANQVRARTVL
jgi:serine/threonine-protein kinase PknG